MKTPISYQYSKIIIKKYLFCFLVTSGLNQLLSAQTFTEHTETNFIPLNSGQLVAVDVNTDGRMDVVETGSDNFQSYFKIFLNNGNFTFTSFSPLSISLSLYSMALADIDNDGDIDMAVCGFDNSDKPRTYIGINNGDTTFSWNDYGLPGITLGGPAWADFDNDGKIDLLLCGINQIGQRITYIYRNTGTGFIEKAKLRGFSSGKVLVFDYNNDGKWDIILTGIDENIQKSTYIFTNRGNFQFVETNPGLDAITSGDMVVADIDDNGWSDIIITGFNQQNKRICKLYKNISGIFLETVNTFSDSLAGSAVSVADFNNDGKLDIIFSGTDNQLFNRTIIYINTGNGTFSRHEFLDIPVTKAAILPVDLNNDRKIDLVITGKTYSSNICKVYENTNATSNVSPNVPTGLSSFVSSIDSVCLQWNVVIDSDQGYKSIHYNIFVGSDKNKGNICSPQSQLLSGKRLIYAHGNAGTLTNKTIHQIPEGKYFWAVQAIDNNHNASPFSAVDSFVICNPLHAVSNDTIICKGDTAILLASPKAKDCNWYTLHKQLIAEHTNRLSFVPLQTDTVILESVHSLGCIYYDTLVVRVISPVSLDLYTDTSGCVGDSLHLQLREGFNNARWYHSTGLLLSDSLSYWHKIVHDDTIRVVAIDTNHCRNISNIIIRVLPLPVFSLGSDRYICRYDSIHLIVPKNFDRVEWYNFSETILKSVSYEYNSRIAQNDSLIVKVIDENGCSLKDTLIIHMFSLPIINLGNDTAICYHDSIFIQPLSSEGMIDWYSHRYGWFAYDTSQVYYRVTATDTLVAWITDNHQCQNIDSLIIQVLPLPNFNLGNDTAVCTGQNILLSAGTGWQSVDWYKAGTGLWRANEWFIEYFPDEVDTLWARVTNKYQCHQTDTIIVMALPLPAVEVGNDTAVCQHDTLILSPNAVYPYVEWKSLKHNTSMFSEKYIYPVLTADTIVLLVKDIHQCQNFDTLHINMLPLPIVPLVSDTSVCMGDTLKLMIPGNWQKIRWESVRSLVKPFDSTTYFYIAYDHDSIKVQLTDIDGCRATKSMEVVVNRLPVSSFHDTAVCRNECLLLPIIDTLVQMVTWQLPNGKIIESGNENFVYCPQSTGSIVSALYSNQNCHIHDTILVTVLDLPAVNLGNDTTVCYGTQLQLGSENMYQPGEKLTYHTWLFVDSAQIHIERPMVSLMQDTAFVLQVINENGCYNADTIFIAVNPPSQFHLPDTLWVCMGESTEQISQPIISGSRYAYRYAWYPDTGINDVNAEHVIFFPTETTTYRLVVQTWLCKPDTAYLTVGVHPLPKIYHTPDVTIGEDGYVQLYVEGGVEYEWWPANSLNQSNISNPIARPSLSTTYTVKVTDAWGCTNFDSVRVFVGNQIFIPDLFSPNGDGTNEVFKIYGIGVLQLTLTISDLQNNILFKSSDLQEIMGKGWDGNFRGNPLPSGQYRWQIQGNYINGQKILYRGKESGILILLR